MKEPRQLAIEARLSHTGWAHGVIVGRKVTRPASRAQIVSGARKILDQLNAKQRRMAQKAA